MCTFRHNVYIYTTVYIHTYTLIYTHAYMQLVRNNFMKYLLLKHIFPQ